MHNKIKATKIIATLGPASQNKAVIRKLIESGVDVFRLNFSHGSHQDHSERYHLIRELESELKCHVAVLADLQGPKLRVGKLARDHMQLHMGQMVKLALCEQTSEDLVIPVPHKEIFAAMKLHEELLLDDGKMRLKIQEVHAEFCLAEVLVGGSLTNNKGINVPGVTLPLSAITEKDKRDLEFALDLGVDWIALSFVQSAADIDMARHMIGSRAKIMAKIEKPRALDEISFIVEKADAIMVARGDLGVELPVEKLPPIQRRLISICRKFHKPVVVATQMLESMIKSPVPTRAEVTDVANAVYEGVDAVMLSAESASGDYPQESVIMMRKVIESVESDPSYRDISSRYQSFVSASVREATVSAAREMAENIGAKAIVIYSFTGDTALSAAGSRPHVPIVVLSPNITTIRQLSLVWGTHNLQAEDVSSVQEMVTQACRVVEVEGFAKSGDHIIVVAGIPFGKPGNPNVIRLVQIGSEEA